DVGLVEHEPERLLLLHPRRPLALAPKLEAHEDALVRQLLRTDTPPEEPHQEPGVDGVRPKLMRRPLVAPRPEREDDRPQLFARGRGVVVEAASVRSLVALDHACVLEEGEPLDEQIPGDAGESPLQPTDTVDPDQELG